MTTSAKSSAIALFVLAVLVSQASCGGKAVSEQDLKVLHEGCQALNPDGRRSACMEVLSRLGDTPQQIQPEPAKAEQPAPEVITLKGVPFDTPGYRDAVMDLCLSSSTGYTADELKKGKAWCKFDQAGRIGMPNFAYGNLGLAWTFPTSIGRAMVNSEGALYQFEESGSKDGMLELASLLGEKYGKPVITESQAENKMGTKFDRKTFVWLDQRGTRITIQSIYDKIDSGRIIIESASRVKTSEGLQDALRSLNKSKL